jgi:hypothetical protein
LESSPPTRQPPARKVPIGDFGDKVLNRFKPTYENNRDRGAYSRVRRVVAFLMQHPSVETTADLTKELITEYVGTCGKLSNNGLIESLRYFRMVCNLAVEWGCLKRNPFVGPKGYPIPKIQHGTAEVSRLRIKLDRAGIKSLLAHLKARTGTWKGHRFYVFTAIIIYTGMTKGEAFKLKIIDGKIRFPKRLVDTEINPELAGILDSWLPLRGQGKSDWRGNRPYGSKLASDGRTRIPDEAEQRVIADMLRWQKEGMGYQRIADKLNSLEIPTKTGNARWWGTSVYIILNNNKNVLDKSVMVSADKDGKRSVSEDGPDWVFPNISGKWHWDDIHRAGDNSCDQLREAGSALGIEGLTFDALRRFHLENTRPITPSLDLGWDRPEPTEARPEPLPAPSRACPVELRGEDFPIILDGEPLSIMKGVAYKMLERVRDGFLEGIPVPACDLAALSESTRIRPLTDALDRPGFKALKRRIRISKVGRKKFIEILE